MANKENNKEYDFVSYEKQFFIVTRVFSILFAKMLIFALFYGYMYQ